MMEEEVRNIVVAGAGYGGLTAVLRLAGVFRSDRGWQIHLVDRNPFHTLKTRLHEAAVFRREVTIDIARVIRKRDIVFHRAAVSGIDTGTRTIRTDREPIPYEYLVLALGSQANFYDIPGLRQFAFSLQSHDDAERIFAHIAAVCARASSEPDERTRRDMLRFVVGGGGLTGIEFAAELADRMDRVGEEYRLNREEVEIVIVERTPDILPSSDESFRRRVREKLLVKKIRVRANTRVLGADAGSVSLSGGDNLRTSTIVWTGGIRVASLFRESGMSTDSSGRIRVDAFLRSVDYPAIFAVGDNAFIVDPRSGEPVPAAAQFALQQGRLVAGNIHAAAQGSRLRPYQPKVLGEVVSLGRHLAVGWLALPLHRKVAFVGFLARLLKTAISEKHLILLAKSSRHWPVY